MGLFSKFFQPKHEGKTNIPDIQFGRYTDRNKTSAQRDCWTKSVEFYEAKKYLDSYYEFFSYLKDPKLDNVQFTKQDDKIVFEFIQGSKIIKGYVSNDEVYAQADVVRFEEQPNVAVMRKLLSENYYLWFSKFTIEGNTFTLKLQAPAIDAHPSGLYFSLKEIANVSDSYDDVLIDEFPFLKPVNTSHIQELPEAEKIVKLKFMRSTITETLEKTEKLDADNFSGARSYLLLNLTYKLYYLLAPEGTLLDELRHIQGIYFSESDDSDALRNYKMIEEYKKVLAKNDIDLAKSLYRVKATFAVVKPSNYQRVSDFIREELEKIRWYKENKHNDIQLAICEYIVAYSCFYFGMNTPSYELLQVFWQVLNNKYFAELGFIDEFHEKSSEKINMAKVNAEIHKIVNHYLQAYPKLNFNTNSLDFRTNHEFATSFLYEFVNCNFEEKE